MCVDHRDAPTPAPSPKPCVCGGGRPCQQREAPHQCFAEARISHSDASLVCPDHTDKCDCQCTDADAPCQYWNQQQQRAFCFAKILDRSTGEMICGDSTDECIAHPEPDGQRTVIDDSYSLGTSDSGDTPVDTHLLLQRDCVYSGWSDWSACDVTCGTGTQKRLPLVSQQASGGGTPCPQPETRSCDAGSCSAVDCQIAGWTAWSACSQNCHGGIMRSEPIIVQQPNRLGEACPLPVTKECNHKPCSPDLHCHCQVFARTLDPDAPPPGSDQVTCTRIHVDGQARVKVLHPPQQSYFKCAYRPASGCQCCMCHLRDCSDGGFSHWGSCSKQWIGSDGNKCPCPDQATPCKDAQGNCLAMLDPVQQTCPDGSAKCEGARLLDIRERHRQVESKTFLSQQCPNLVVTEMCGDWATTATGQTPAEAA